MATSDSRRANLISKILTNDRLGTQVMLFWLALLLIGMVWDQWLLLPSPAPTDAQLMRARPIAARDWKRVYTRIAERQRKDGYQPEFGEVWTIRTGRICGVVNGREAGIDYMTRFYADDGRPVTREEDRRGHLHWWLDCLDTRWVRLHAGTEKTGFCASKRGRESALGRDYCRDGKGWPQMDRYPDPQ